MNENERVVWQTSTHSIHMLLFWGASNVDIFFVMKQRLDGSDFLQQKIGSFDMRNMKNMRGRSFCYHHLTRHEEVDYNLHVQKNIQTANKNVIGLSFLFHTLIEFLVFFVSSVTTCQLKLWFVIKIWQSFVIKIWQEQFVKRWVSTLSVKEGLLSRS